MTGPAKIVAACALGGLVLVTAYTVALGGSGWLWLAWLVLGLVAVGLLFGRGT